MPLMLCARLAIPARSCNTERSDANDARCPVGHTCRAAATLEPLMHMMLGEQLAIPAALRRLMLMMLRARFVIHARSCNTRAGYAHDARCVVGHTCKQMQYWGADAHDAGSAVGRTHTQLQHRSS